MARWNSYAEALVRRMTAERVPLDDGWRRAFLATPRHLFVPVFYRADQRFGPTTPIDSRHPEWLAAAYADEPLATKHELVPIAGDGEMYVATSSSSQPTIIAIMLDRLAVAAGSRVLEVGTGTGYHAALLCHRLGDGNVTSVDLDAELVETAAERLARLGYRPHLVAGDGADGVASRAPYDRIVATCAADRVHPAWIRQLAPGGRMVLPLVDGGALAVLDKTGPERVEGRIDAEPAFFMPLRAAGPVEAGEPWPPSELPEDVDPSAPNDRDFQLWLGLTWRYGGDIAEVWQAFLAAGRPRRGDYRVVATTAGGEVRVGERRWSLPPRV